MNQRAAAGMDLSQAPPSPLPVFEDSPSSVPAACLATDGALRPVDDNTPPQDLVEPPRAPRAARAAARIAPYPRVAVMPMLASSSAERAVLRSDARVTRFFRGDCASCVFHTTLHLGHFLICLLCTCLLIKVSNSVLSLFWCCIPSF